MQRNESTVITAWFCIISIVGAILLAMVYMMPDKIVLDIIITAIIFRIIFWRLFIFKVPAGKVALLANSLAKERAQSYNQAIRHRGETHGLRPAKRGFNVKLPTEEFLDLIPIKEVAVPDLEDKVTWQTSDRQQVFVDDEFFVCVVPELAVEYYRYTNSGGTIENITSYMRGKTEGFKKRWISTRTLDQLRGDVAAFDSAFKAFVANDPDLERLMLRFGVRVSNPSIFNVELTKATKDADAAKAQAQRKQDAVKVIKDMNPGISDLEANQIWLTMEGLADMRIETIIYRGVPTGIHYFAPQHGGGGKGKGGGGGGEEVGMVLRP